MMSILFIFVNFLAQVIQTGCTTFETIVVVQSVKGWAGNVWVAGLNLELVLLLISFVGLYKCI